MPPEYSPEEFSEAAVEALVDVFADCITMLAVTSHGLPVLIAQMKTQIADLEPLTAESLPATIRWHAACEILKKLERVEAEIARLAPKPDAGPREQ